MLGPARSVRAWGWDLSRTGRRSTVPRSGSAARTSSSRRSSSRAGAVVRLTASFYVGPPGEATGSLEFHGDDASLALGSFQDFDATVEVGRTAGTTSRSAHVRPAFRGTAWARGVADMAAAIAEGRPHRASAEQAAHVVDILEAAASRWPTAAAVEVASTFAPPPLMPWAEGRARAARPATRRRPGAIRSSAAPARSSGGEVGVLEDHDPAVLVRRSFQAVRRPHERRTLPRDPAEALVEPVAARSRAHPARTRRG